MKNRCAHDGDIEGFSGFKGNEDTLIIYWSQLDSHTNVFSRALREIRWMKEQIYHKALSYMIYLLLYPLLVKDTICNIDTKHLILVLQPEFTIRERVVSTPSGPVLKLTWVARLRTHNKHEGKMTQTHHYV